MSPAQQACLRAAPKVSFVRSHPDPSGFLDYSNVVDNKGPLGFVPSLFCARTLFHNAEAGKAADRKRGGLRYSK